MKTIWKYKKWLALIIISILMIYFSSFEQVKNFYLNGWTSKLITEEAFSKLIKDSLSLLINIYSILTWFLWVWISLILWMNNENIQNLKKTKIKWKDITYYDSLINYYKITIYTLLISLLLSITSFFLFDILYKVWCFNILFYTLLISSFITFINFEKVIRILFLLINNNWNSAEN